MERHQSINQIKNSLEEKYKDNEDCNLIEVMGYFKKIEKDVVRSQILNNKTRIDGRNLDEVRDISSEVSWLPRTHGSALFTRGETQAIVVATLGFGAVSYTHLRAHETS